MDIVSPNQRVGSDVGRIVGSCSDARQKIVYARREQNPGGGEATAQTPPGPAPISKVDARGFIDVWALRKDVIALANMPMGQNECSRGEGDDEEEVLASLKTRKARLAYERQRRKDAALARKAEARCEQDNLRKSQRFEQLRAAFNASWLPVLKGATQLGDPVAEVVLRLCETTALLDRSQIAADCSAKADDQAYARQRLETIDFKAALHKYTPTAHADAWHQRQAVCGKGGAIASTECGYRAEIARYERILSVMRTGYLAVAESWNTCQMGGETPELDKLVEECQRLMNLMIAVSAGSNRFYAVGPIDGGDQGLSQLSLERPILRGKAGVPWKDWPYDSRGIVSRNDWRKFSDPHFQRKFYDELDRTVQEIEANIAADLRKEPRWAVFLVERLGRKLYDAMDTANSNRPTPATRKP